ncbi:hypothetical protein PHMEG_00034526 [Phytophthora megakarya]|uniref:Reverse transcriptase Ty1/copia-type domain-containing protein n=1 Tax=Phytophthora megakarya TaxID=4795 RepID=A0A225UR17_9STRA|nr:hypothetical protein PHMEG_00034526 [Phytophthora megakarya]
MTRAVVKQYDVVTAFLNAPMDKVIFMEQSEGHVKRGYEGWTRLFIGSGWRLLPIYVDDILLIGCEHDVDFFADTLKARFQIKELGTVCK